MTCVLSLSTVSKADIYIDILGGEDQLIPIAVLPSDSQISRPLKHDMSQIISNDLLRSGLFSLIKVPPHGAVSEEGIGYRFYRKLGIENIVVPTITKKAQGGYEVKIDLYDVLLKEKRKSYTVQFSDSQVRRVSHQLSDLIFREIIGRQSAFSSKLAFITVNKKNKKRLYRLKISNSDGYNAKTILKSTAPILSPAWSPDGKQLTYVSFENGLSEIFIHHIRQGKREKVASFKGINSSPAWSPDGKFLLMTLSYQGNSEIYLMHIESKSVYRLTNNPAIDTEASFSADGKHIFFTSDRTGSPQIYRANFHNHPTQPRINRIKLLTKKGSYNAGASLAQDGKYLALIHSYDGRLGVSLYDIENEEFYPITTTKLDDSPSLSPGANMVVYSAMAPNKKDGQLIIMDLRSKSKISLRTLNGAVKDPAWGPINKAIYKGN